MAKLQAMAAVGQPHLMAHYDTLFSALSQPIAQVLLTADALGTRSGYNNSKATFDQVTVDQRPFSLKGGDQEGSSVWAASGEW